MIQANTVSRDRIRTLRWAFPLTFAGLAIIYQLGLARWVFERYGEAPHFAVETIFYATVGPLLAFWALSRIQVWLDERDRLESEARASEKRLVSITAASADAILGLDPEGRVESWNQGAELLFGLSADEMIGRPFAELFGGGEAAEVEFAWLSETVHKSGFLRGYETACRGGDGRQLDVDLTATDLTDDRGNSFGLSVILRDITARKQREEEIRRLNANLNQQVNERTKELAAKIQELALANEELSKLDQTRSEFVSLVSHQIRAPLTNMQGAVERMQTSCATVSPTCSRMFTILENQVTRLDRLVQDVLNATRIEAGDIGLQPEPVSVQPLVHQAVEQIQARHSSREFELPSKPGLPLAFADRDRVAEVLGNLLDNADKYSPPGEKVRLQVRADEEWITVSVSDSGPGLPDGETARIFDKFYRTDSSDRQSAYGYGLGLYVCRLLVESQGGRIWAENDPHGGAVFSFTLPIWQGKDEPAPNSVD